MSDLHRLRQMSRSDPGDAGGDGKAGASSVIFTESGRYPADDSGYRNDYHAMQLYDADGKVVDSFPSVNPQVSYGADVLSRIEAARDPGKAADMQKKVLGLIEKGVQRFFQKYRRRSLYRWSLRRIPLWTYLLMGWDPAELGRAPFQVSHCGAVDTQIAGISCHIIPGLSAFVGGDITAGILACQMLEQEEPMLLIDLGTNGEMALGNRQKLYACATAAGPAFEGGANRGIWGADMVKLLQKLLKRD